MIDARAAAAARIATLRQQWGDDLAAPLRLRVFNLLQSITKLIARNAQQFSGAGLVASAPFHRLAHQRQLDLLRSQ